MIDDMNVYPGWRLHPLTGALKGFWSISVTGNWRLIFRFEDGDAFSRPGRLSLRNVCHEGPLSPRRNHPRGSAQAPWSDRDRRGQGAPRRPADPIEPAQRKCVADSRDGTAHREGFRPEDGAPDAHAA